MRTFTITTTPYDTQKLYTYKKHTIEPGLTVLVGCNGCGKSTFMSLLQSNLKKENIPVFKYDNLTDGGINAASKYLYEDLDICTQLISGSEGENIQTNISYQANYLRHFILTGSFNSKAARFEQAFTRLLTHDQPEKADIKHDERWLFFDAIDSGSSIDNVIEIKEFFNTMIEDGKRHNIDIYIIVSANAYEMCNGSSCYDVQKGRYITFDDYCDYKKFILNTRKFKNNMMEKYYAKKENLT